MKKKVIIMCLFCLIFISIAICRGSYEKQKEVNSVIDITGVLQFADKVMSDKGVEISEKSICQRTNDETTFLVEYRGKNNGNKYHYGYYIQIVNQQYVIIQEGENVDKNIL